MKISCQSCQAKYTIADEKVLGKIVKIRCKKCGATIVINGNEAESSATHAEGAAPQQGAGVYDYSSQTGGESWTVNVADGDQRTMNTAEVVAAFRGGLINEETFCWKDGMADWLPIRDVPEIMGALGAPSFHQEAAPPAEDATQVHQPAMQAPAPAAAAQPQPGFSSLFGGGGSVGQNGGQPLFGGGAEPAAAAPAAAARRAGGRGGGGADLFGSAAAAGGEEDVMTSASSNPQMAPGGDKRTGERNENSVLFSLNALTDAAPKKETPMAQGEGSGLIDIRALSSSMKDESKGNNKVDDIMNLSGGGAFSAALAAPVLAPPPADMQEMQGGQQQKKGSLGLIIGIVAGFAVLGLIIVAALIVLRKPENIAPIPSATVATTAAAGTGSSASTSPTDTASAAPATSVATGPTTSATKPGVGVSGTGAKPPTGVTNTGGGNPSGGNTAPVVTPPTGGGGGRCNCAASDFNCKMAEGAGAPCPAAGGGVKPPTDTGGGAPFDRSAAGGALGGIAGNLSSCKKSDGPTGSGHVKVTFQPNGSVSSVEVDQAPFAGTAVGACVAAKFRSAHVPAFSGAPMTVGKTFALN